jgi:predicted secreted protein
MIIHSLLRFTMTCLVLSTGYAQAADMAEYRVFGYSADGTVFAFEEYGVQDGSGFSFSNIYMIDLEKDRWLANTPIRVRLDDETVPLATARALARQQGADLFATHDIDGAFRTLAATTPMELSDQQETLAFYPRAILTPIDPLHTLTLNQIALESPRDCFNLAETAGFELLLTVDGQGTATVHRDETLPMSRQCPVRYGLAAVIAPFNAGPGRAVALISIYQLGFEGSDRRFLAVPFDLKF